MRKLFLGALSTICVFILTFNAMALGSGEYLYQAGNKYIGIGYNSSQLATVMSIYPINDSGIMLKGGYCITDNIDINLAYIVANWSLVNSTGNGNILTAMVDYHTSLAPTLGLFVGAGSITYTFDTPLSTSASSFGYEIGFETQLSNNMTAYLGVQSGTPTITINGFPTKSDSRNYIGGINFFF